MRKVMGHDEAIDKAVCTLIEIARSAEAQMEAAIRAYIEARGLALVPNEPTDEMIGFGFDGYNAFAKPSNKICNAYRRMIKSAPDPFKDDEA